MPMQTTRRLKRNAVPDGAPKPLVPQLKLSSLAADATLSEATGNVNQATGHFVYHTPPELEPSETGSATAASSSEQADRLGRRNMPSSAAVAVSQLNGSVMADAAAAAEVSAMQTHSAAHSGF